MNPSNDSIIITDSRNLDESPASSTIDTQEGEEASLRALENQGVSIVEEAKIPTAPVEEHRDQFSRDLLEEGGIEIIRGDDDEAFS